MFVLDKDVLLISDHAILLEPLGKKDRVELHIDIRAYETPAFSLREYINLLNDLLVHTDNVVIKIFKELLAHVLDLLQLSREWVDKKHFLLGEGNIRGICPTHRTQPHHLIDLLPHYFLQDVSLYSDDMNISYYGCDVL